MDHVISIYPNGTVRTLYTDRIDLREFGPLHVERASNVEWDDTRRGWTVQFADGSFLCNQNEDPITYITREAALAAEVDFLQARM